MKRTSAEPGFPFEVRVAPSPHGGYYARVDDLPTVFTGGDTPEQALANARDAVDLLTEEHAARGLPLPEPTRAFTGHFNVRVPRSLHRDLARRAEAEGVSLNALISWLLARQMDPGNQGLAEPRAPYRANPRPPTRASKRPSRADRS